MKHDLAFLSLAALSSLGTFSFVLAIVMRMGVA